MDPEYARRDARAVEDPIAAVFDLAESVDRQTPKIRKVLRYARWFVSLWLLLDFFLILILSKAPGVSFLLFVPIIAFLFAARYLEERLPRLTLTILAFVFGALQVVTAGEAFLVNALFVSLFILGFIILDLMRDLRSFFDYFALRHRVILAVRQADPIVHIPQGKDAASRMLVHLGATSPDIRAVMAIPGGVAAPAILTGRSGLAYNFDAYVRSEPTQITRLLGIGHPGLAVFVKAFERAPTAADLQSLKTAVEDVSLASRIPPARVLAVWRAHGDESIAPDAYAFLTSEAARVTIRGSTYACSLELAREGDDGTYDFIPVVVDARGSMQPATPSPL